MDSVIQRQRKEGSFMDIKKIKELIALVEESGISEIAVEEDNVKIQIKKETEAQVIQATVPQPVVHQVTAADSTGTTSDQGGESSESSNGLIPITSQMVGTFYAASNPDAAPFVAIGKSINNGDVVCIVEAMKLYNEIESEVSGVIEKVCVENGTPVEFGQTLFLVRGN